MTALESPAAVLGADTDDAAVLLGDTNMGTGISRTLGVDSGTVSITGV